MHIVRIEHSVPNFEKWKQAFDVTKSFGHGTNPTTS